jgi:succinoglycan biosynthesis transport protein ExoP
MAINYSLKRWDDQGPVTVRPLVGKSDAEEIQFRNIVHILSKRRWLILLFAGIGVLAASLVSIAMHRVYSATATIEVDKDAPESINLRDQAANAGVVASGMDLGTDLLTEQSVVANDTTLLTVINRLNLRSKPPFAYDPKSLDKDSPLVQQANLPLDQAPAVRARDLDIFNKHLVVRVVKGTRLIEVRYSDPDPNQAAAVTNAILDAYLANYTQTRYETSSKISSWLAQQLEGLKDDVEQSQKKVTDFEEESGLIGSSALSPEGAAGEKNNNVELNRLVDLNRELTTAEIDRVGKEAVYRLTQTENPDVVVGLGSTALAQTVGANAAVVGPGNKDIALLQQLRNQQAALKIQYASDHTTYGAKNPVLLQISNQLGAIDGQISEEMSRIRLLAKNDYILSRKAEEGVREGVHQQEQQITKLNRSTAKLDVLEQQARSNRTLYEDLYGKLQEARMASGVRASNTNIVNPARTSDRPSAPRVPLNLGLGLALGLFCGCTASLVAEYFDDSVEGIDEIEGLTGVHILGTIPTFAINSSAGTQKTLSPLNPNGEDRVAVGGFLNAPSSAAAEAYRGFRTSLLAYRPESRPQTLLFTSPELGDGKTTTCINSAVALAQLGCRIVIVDADLRRSSLRGLTNVERGVGLSHVLSGQADLMSVIRPYRGVANLSILTSGDLPAYPAELLGSKRFSDVLKTLRDKFDFVFIDSPPLLLVTDALLLATLVDGVVLVLRAAHTTRPALRNALRLLQRVHAPLLGSVLNCVNSKSAEYKTIDSDKIRSTQYAN